MLDTASFWMRLAAGLGAGALCWCAAFGFGGFALRSPHAAVLRPSERVLLAGTLGFAFVGSAVALIGSFGAITPLRLGAIVALGLAGFAANWGKSVITLRLRGMASGLDGADRFAWFVTGCAWLTAATAAALPTVDWDPLAYHLPIVFAALQHGALSFDPSLAQSAFPLLAEAASTPAYWLGGSAGASSFVLGSGVIFALLSCAVAERVRAGTGALVCALVSSSAVWLWLAPAPYVDVPFAMFAIAAFGIALCVPGLDARGAALAGLLAGASAAVKYPGLITIAIVIGLIAFRADPRARMKAIAAALTLAVVMCAGWYYRSWASTGDPIYPFLSGHLGASGAVRDFAARYVQMTRDWCGGPATVTDFLALPWRLLVHPQQFCGDPGYSLRLASVLVVAALFVRAARPFALLTALLLAVWFWTSRQWRFLVPAIATYAIAAAAGLDALAARQRTPIRALLLVVALAGVALDWLPQPASDASNSISPAYAYIAGHQSGAEYLATRLESYAADRWALLHARPGSYVAALDDVRNYYLYGAAIDLNPYYQQRAAIDWSSSPAHRYDVVRDLGASLLIVNENVAYLRRTPVGVDWEALASDVRSGVLRRVFDANNVIVYALPAAKAPL